MTRGILLVLLLLMKAGISQASPACFPPGTAPEQQDHTFGMDRWLSRSSTVELQQYYSKLSSSERWKQDEPSVTLILACGIQGPPVDMTSVRLTVRAKESLDATRQRFSEIATMTGHSQQEAEVLAKKVNKLQQAFFRNVKDEQGHWVPEDQLIQRRHEKALGIDNQEEKARQTFGNGGKDGSRTAEKEAAQSLKKKIKEARARGDMAEVMRLAGEAQQMAAPTLEKGKNFSNPANITWDLSAASVDEQLQAAYWTQIELGQCPCLICAMPGDGGS